MEAKNKTQYRGPKTPGPLMKQAQAIARSIPKREDGSHISEREKQLGSDFLVWFDGVYRPYVYMFLKKRGFRDLSEEENGYPELCYPGTQVEGQDVYLKFRRKFLETILLNFDFDKPRVGQGAFRNFIKVTIDTIISDMLNLVPLRNKRGEIVYTDKPRRHKDGTVMVDKDGNVLYKPQKVPFCVADSEKVERARGGDVADEAEDASISPLQQSIKEDMLPSYSKPMGKTSVSENQKVNVVHAVLMLAKVAYLKALYDWKEGERRSWRLDVVEAVYERFENPHDVMARLIDSGTIKGRTNFDNVKSLFLSAWYRAWWNLWSKIAQGPKVKMVGGKLKRLKGAFVWQPTKNLDEIRAFVSDQIAKCKTRVGAQRWQELNENYDAMLKNLTDLGDGSGSPS